MNNTTGFKILVVEDDHDWREGLCQLYEEMLKPLNPYIFPASDGSSALKLIKSMEFDLLSLDINLSETHPKDTEGKPKLDMPGADGRAILRAAYERKSVKGVVVITALDYDAELYFIIPNDAERKRIRMTFDLFLQDYFPNRNIIIKKIIDWEVQDSIGVIRESLTLEKLCKTCCKVNYFYKEGEYWHVNFNGKSTKFKDCVGIQRLYHVMRYPNEPIPVDFLMGTFMASPEKSLSPLFGAKASMIPIGNGVEIHDKPSQKNDNKNTINRYKEQIKGLEELMNEAEENNDRVTSLLYRKEKEDLEEELSNTIKNKQKDKSLNAFSQDYLRLIQKIQKNHPEFETYLKQYVQRHRGYCTFSPPPNSIPWIFSPQA
jgi:CheY-like chemotaxis protein